MPILDRRAVLAATLGLTAAASLAPARADDRPVTPEERRQIEATLRREGFVRWGEIELDDGRFEVDDAIAADGRKYDLELSRVDFSILKRERDD
ncbi:PepSY domain-containing protein [Phreatobacter sp. HK31-P]